jgi:predicted AlkP superfamily phosphohydrolase/phosphomutase
MNKLPNAKVKKVEVYPNQNAQLYYPINPEYFDYIIISSRPLEYYKKTIIQKNFPLYSAKWSDFENKLQDTKYYELIKEYVLPKPNLIPLSDVYIYKNLSPIKIPEGASIKDNL